MTPRLAEPLHVCSTPTLAHIVNTARASSIITEAWSRFDSRFFVCKYFVVRLSTTKTTKILPLEKYPLYGNQCMPAIDEKCISSYQRTRGHFPWRNTCFYYSEGGVCPGTQCFRVSLDNHWVPTRCCQCL